MCAIFHGHWLRGDGWMGRGRGRGRGMGMGRGRIDSILSLFPLPPPITLLLIIQLHLSFRVVQHCQVESFRAIKRNVSEHLVCRYGNFYGRSAWSFGSKVANSGRRPALKAAATRTNKNVKIQISQIVTRDGDHVRGLAPGKDMCVSAL